MAGPSTGTDLKTGFGRRGGEGWNPSPGGGDDRANESWLICGEISRDDLSGRMVPDRDDSADDHLRKGGLLRRGVGGEPMGGGGTPAPGSRRRGWPRPPRRGVPRDETPSARHRPRTWRGAPGRGRVGGRWGMRVGLARPKPTAPPEAPGSRHLAYLAIACGPPPPLRPVPLPPAALGPRRGLRGRRRGGGPPRGHGTPPPCRTTPAPPARVCTLPMSHRSPGPARPPHARRPLGNRPTMCGGCGGSRATTGPTAPRFVPTQPRTSGAARGRVR